MYISYVNTVAKAHLFTAVFHSLQYSLLIATSSYPGIETIWKLHTLTVIANSNDAFLTPYVLAVNTNSSSCIKPHMIFQASIIVNY